MRGRQIGLQQQPPPQWCMLCSRSPLPCALAEPVCGVHAASPDHKRCHTHARHPGPQEGGKREEVGVLSLSLGSAQQPSSARGDRGRSSGTPPAHGGNSTPESLSLSSGLAQQHVRRLGAVLRHTGAQWKLCPWRPQPLLGLGPAARVETGAVLWCAGA